MAKKTYLALVMAGMDEFKEVSSVRAALSAEDLADNVFGYYHFDADSDEMEENPKAATKTNVSGTTYKGVVHKVDDVLWDISTIDMENAIKGADTEQCVACPYGDTAMLFPFMANDSVIS